MVSTNTCTFFQDDKLFSVFLCLRLVVQPTHVLEELRDRINANLITQQDIKEAKPATCRRVKRGATIAQSFSMGTVARTRMNRRSVRLSEEGTSENDNNNSRYSDHIKVVDAFDEILSELETVRVSMPKSETTTTSPTSTRIRPSSIKQRPYSTFVAKSNFDEEEERVRDSGYMSQHNSQSSVASSASASATDDEIFAEPSIDVDQMIFSLIDYWSLHFTGDLQYHDTLHLVMEILEKLRQRNKVSTMNLEKLYLSAKWLHFCVSHFDEKLGTTVRRLSKSDFHYPHMLAPGQGKYA